MAIKNPLRIWGTDTAENEKGMDPFVALQQNIEQELENFSRWFGKPLLERWRIGSWETFDPRINVTRSNGNVHVEAELPGMDEKDVQVSVTDNVLTVQGERKEEKKEEDKEKQTYRREFSYGSFCRSVTLPAEVMPEKAKAVFKNGVLTVDLPVSPTEAAKTQKIAVKSA